MPHLPFPCLHSHMVPAIPELISSTIMNPHKAGLTPAGKCPGSLVRFLLPTPHNRLHAVSCCQLLGLCGGQSAQARAPHTHTQLQRLLQGNELRLWPVQSDMEHWVVKQRSAWTQLPSCMVQTPQGCRDCSMPEPQAISHQLPQHRPCKYKRRF